MGSLLLSSALPLLILQLAADASVFHRIQVLVQLFAPGYDLLFAEFVGLMFLSKDEQQVFLPISFKTRFNLCPPSGRHARSELVRLLEIGSGRPEVLSTGA